MTEIMEKKRTGAPFKLEVNENLLSEIETLASFGLTLEDISLFLKINESTFHNYKNKFPEIKQAVEKGRSSGKAVSGKALIRKVMDGDISAIKWYEQSRHGYSEKIKTENEHTVRYEPIEHFLKRVNDEKKLLSVNSPDNIVSDPNNDLPISPGKDIDA
jgi:hypothetical protein